MKKIGKGTTIVLMFIAWWFGWQFSNDWTRLAMFLEIKVYTPYAPFWEWGLLLLPVGFFGALSGILLWDWWRHKRWMEEWRERQRCRQIWEEILRYGNDYY